jgi:hypothetical protein
MEPEVLGMGTSDTTEGHTITKPGQNIKQVNTWCMADTWVCIPLQGKFQMLCETDFVTLP